MTIRAVLATLAMIGGLAAVASAQDLQIGAKTAPAMFVAYTEHESATATISDDVGPAITSLWTACRQAGLHPIALPMLSLDVVGLAGGTVKWEAWMMLADQLDPQKLPDKPGLKIKNVPATPVVYTYHQGDPADLPDTFARLQSWATNHNLPATTQLRAIVYSGAFTQDRGDVLIECQFEQKQ